MDWVKKAKLMRQDPLGSFGSHPGVREQQSTWEGGSGEVWNEQNWSKKNRKDKFELGGTVNWEGVKDYFLIFVLCKYIIETYTKMELPGWLTDYKRTW